MTAWTPDLSGKKGPKYKLIADAIGSAVRAGEIEPGMRLPTHRDLANQLKLTVGTITRGYAEAARRGLIEGETGRGTYVRQPVSEKSTPEARSRPDKKILAVTSKPSSARPTELRVNGPQSHQGQSNRTQPNRNPSNKTGPSRVWPTRPLKRLTATGDRKGQTSVSSQKSTATVDNTPTGSLLSLLTAPLLHTMRRQLMQAGEGRAGHVKIDPDTIGRLWLKPLGIAQSKNIATIITNGSDAVLSACFAALTQSGCGSSECGVLIDAGLDRSLVQPLSRFGAEFHPVLSDDDGLIPESLELAAWTSGARSLVIMPTSQTPDLKVIPEARRVAIAKAAVKFDLTIIEMEGPARRIKAAYPPIAAFIPERTIYISSLVDLFSPWVTAGFVALPKHLESRVKNALDRQGGAVNPLFTSVLASWTESGIARQVETAIQAEAEARASMAKNVFADQEARFRGLAGWLSLEKSATGQQSLAKLNAATDGLLSLQQAGPEALSFSLSETETAADLQRVLVRLKEALAETSAR